MTTTGISLKSLILTCCICCSFIIKAQIIQERSNKYQLKDGIKLDPKINTDKLVKIAPTKVLNSVQVQEKTIVPKKKEKPKKPVKVLKYGIKKKDNE